MEQCRDRVLVLMPPVQHTLRVVQDHPLVPREKVEPADPAPLPGRIMPEVARAASGGDSLA
jgi:hypothetical protein